MRAGWFFGAVGLPALGAYLIKNWIQIQRMPYRFTCEECGLKVSSSSRDAIIKAKVIHNEHHLGARS